MNVLIQNYLTRGFWGDEAWTALISSLSIQEIIRVTGEDFHPPLYYLLVHGFVILFGSSEWIRLISVGFWLLTPLSLFLLMKKVSRGAAWASLLLVLFAPILFIYAFEARAYALLAFLSAFTSAAFWKSMAVKDVRWLVAYTITAVIGVYTHYYMWFIIAAHGIAWLVLYRKRFWGYLLVFGVIILAQLPWMTTLISQVSSVKQSYWIGQIGPRTHWEWLIRTVGGDVDQPQRMFVVVTILLLLLASPILVRWRYKKWPKAYVYLWIWLLVPVLIPTLLSFVYRPIFFWRYLVFCTIPILLLVVRGLEAIHEYALASATAFIMAMFLSINWLNLGRYPYSMREEMEKIFANPQAAKKIVTVLPSFAEVMFYTKNRLPVRVLPAGLVQSSGKALLDSYERSGRVTVGVLGSGENYWFVEPGPRSNYNADLSQ